MTEATEAFEPRIVGFLCNWCSYAGADAAGTGRLKYSPNMRVIRVMCSGRVAPELVIRAFREGADGVMVLG
jgi:F420-non-reducing hydrogenase iron-sulfur subunit